MNSDRDHLQLLSIFHYIAGVLAALIGLFPILPIVMGAGMVTGEASSTGQLIAGWAMMLLWLLFMAVAFTYSWAAIRAAKYLVGHQRHFFCVVVACVDCAFAPFGVVLGVFSLVVLMRPSVKELFGVVEPAPPARPFGGPA